MAALNCLSLAGFNTAAPPKQETPNNNAGPATAGDNCLKAKVLGFAVNRNNPILGSGQYLDWKETLFTGSCQWSVESMLATMRIVSAARRRGGGQTASEWLRHIMVAIGL